jgi:catechol 2,3-dioxygenase-like lactoylglutathione lyase family enzyme
MNYSGSIKIGNIGLNVSDIEISKTFYQEILGLRVSDESPQLPLRYVSMTRDGRTVFTLWENSRVRLGNCPPALHRLTFVADSTEEVNRTKGLLENSAHAGARRILCAHRHLVRRYLHFEDPDGIPIELCSLDGETPALEDSPTGSATPMPRICSEPLTTDKGIKNDRLI